ncbi:MAG: type II toxin-antitoxin system RelE family toxin [Dyadobacter fermentans]
MDIGIDRKLQRIPAEDTDEVYRARAGNYRIFYEINDRELSIMIVKIGDRKDVYD